VVEGSVRKAGDRVRISAQLIDATTGQHVWAERYDRELRDIFALQDEITGAIVAQMYPELMRSEQESVVRSEPKNLDAYDCERRASWYSARSTKEDNAKARLLYERATELNPYAATAFRGLAFSHYRDVFLQWTDLPAKSIEHLVQAAQRSVELDAKDSYGQLALGIAYRVTAQPDKATAAYELAVRLNPSLVIARYHLGVALAFRGSADEAIASLDKAMRLSPHDWMMWLLLNGVAMAHALAERQEEALEWANRSVRLKPDWPFSHVVLAGCYADLDRVEEARREVDEVRRLNPAFSLAGIELLFASADPGVRERIVESLRKAGLPE
jgi:adenylate cyclase